MSEGRPIYWGEMSKGRGVQIVRAGDMSTGAKCLVFFHNKVT